MGDVMCTGCCFSAHGGYDIRIVYYKPVVNLWLTPLHCRHLFAVGTFGSHEFK